MPASTAATVAARAPGLLDAFLAVRRRTEQLAAPLSDEDCVAQSMPEASPIKWNLGHTAWFFETFVLGNEVIGRPPHHPAWGFLFNSYYEALGERVARPRRGLLTRPGRAEVMAYRRAVDDAVVQWLAHGCDEGRPDHRALLDLVELGIHHEQQHQELLLTDCKHLLAQNPLDPAYAGAVPDGRPEPSAMAFVPCDGGTAEIGKRGDGFAFDNERPVHRVWLQPYALANRTVTAGEFLRFVDAGGYRQARFWLSDGWDWLRAQGIEAPLYWRREGDGSMSHFTLAGRQPLDPHAPVTHVSFYEAEAFARFAGARLPTEAEWEHAAATAAHGAEGTFADDGALHPRRVAGSGEDARRLAAMFGDVWEWTASPYTPYPGYRPADGAIGEYNGKFMCNQMVLRGGSCATPRDHLRPTYRNFFHAHARWQFSGIRLAKDLA